MLTRTRTLLFFLTITGSASKIPVHFRNYPSASQNGYDVQNPYSYPVRNADIPPCVHASPILDNRTSAQSSISYVPVQAPPNIQRQPTIYPQMNGHQQKETLAQLAGLSSKASETKTSLPYPTYETDAQVEMRRQLALWQASQQMTSTPSLTTTTNPSVSNYPTLVSSTSQTTDSEPHALSQLSPDELAAYASRLRQQFQQERQQVSQTIIPNTVIRGKVNSIMPQPSIAVKLPTPLAPANTLPIQSSTLIPLSRPRVEVSNITYLANNSIQNGTLQPLEVVPMTKTLNQTITPIQLPLGPAPKLTHEINYCDRRQFDDELLESLHLKHSDYFIYNTSCDGTFFQCAIGQTFVLKCPDVTAQAFDPTISSCNFKTAVRFCPEYDHVLHCTIRESCTPNQFACCELPQQCIDYSLRCNGQRDCLSGEDEQNCASCKKDEFACAKSGKCIPAKKRCDGNPDDCGDGTNLDEIGCSKNETCLGRFVCSSPESLAQMKHSVCVDLEKYCDGKVDCPFGEDEKDCRLNDDSATKYLSCENQKQQVRKEQWCDGREDCADGSDEKFCFR